MTANPVAAAFDQPTICADHVGRLAEARRLYVIYIIARSGSTWLTEQASLTGLLGIPQEWLNQTFIHGLDPALGCLPPRAVGATDINAYLEISIAKSQSTDGVAGIQLSRWQTGWVCEIADDPKSLIKLTTPFFLRRKNLVDQAISLYRSNESGLFHSYQSGHGDLRERFDATQYVPERIRAVCEELLRDELWFETFFAQRKIAPYCFTYEDMLRDMPAVLQWMRGVLGAPASKPASGQVETMYRISDGRSHEWGDRFRREEADFVAAIEVARPTVQTDAQLAKMLRR